MIAIKEFIAQLDQGYAEGFLCRGEDEHLYAVKSRKSGCESLVREWICGSIGQQFSVPIPPIDLVFTTSTVATYSGNEQLAALAEMPGFSSRFVTSGVGPLPHGLPTLNVTDIPSIDATLRRRVLLFDWWILNFDRTDDNPNMLWDTVNQTLHVIDHNLAFDHDPPAAFWTDHIFRHDGAALSDAAPMANDLLRMQAILEQLPNLWSKLPERWTDVSGLTLAKVDRILRRCETKDFWHPQ